MELIREDQISISRVYCNHEELEEALKALDEDRPWMSVIYFKVGDKELFIFHLSFSGIKFVSDKRARTIEEADERLVEFNLLNESEEEVQNYIDLKRVCEKLIATS
jgi:hypothetical protein